MLCDFHLIFKKKIKTNIVHNLTQPRLNRPQWEFYSHLVEVLLE